MTREEAIKRFENQLKAAIVVLDSGFGTHPGENDRLYRERKEMAQLAIAALREQEERENPKPLTMDELRQMDGEPVWIERCGSDSQDDKEWALVFDAGGFCRTSVGNIAFFALYGIGWLAYRSKPKEE